MSRLRRDSSKEWFRLPVAVLQRSGASSAVIMAFLIDRQSSDFEACCTIQEMITETGLSRSTCIRAVQKLIEDGWIKTVVHTGRESVYCLYNIIGLKANQK